MDFTQCELPSSSSEGHCELPSGSSDHQCELPSASSDHQFSGCLREGFLSGQQGCPLAVLCMGFAMFHQMTLFSSSQGNGLFSSVHSYLLL